MSSKIEKAVQQMEQWAKDDSHGYDQTYRWGEYGDYDCSSSIIQALENSGIPAKSKGATYTGNMYQVLTKLGFKDITSSVNLSNGSGIKRGDILLNHINHVSMSIGNGKLVQASINEQGGVSGGKPGDQTGNEFHIRSYYNYPWNCILRFVEPEESTNTGHTGGNTEPTPNTSSGSESSFIGMGRITKKTKCLLSPSPLSEQSKIIPNLPKGMLVDLVSDVYDYYLVQFCVPKKGTYKEYIHKNDIMVIK